MSNALALIADDIYEQMDVVANATENKPFNSEIQAGFAIHTIYVNGYTEATHLSGIFAHKAAEAERVRLQAAANLKAERAALDEHMRIQHERDAAWPARANSSRRTANNKFDHEVAEHIAMAPKLAAKSGTEGERERLQALAEQQLVDARTVQSSFPAGHPVCDLTRDWDLDIDADESTSDDEIIELVANSFNLSKLEAIARLAAIDFAGAHLCQEIAA